METTLRDMVARQLDELAQRLGHERARDEVPSRGEVYALLVELIGIVNRLNESVRK